MRLREGTAVLWREPGVIQVGADPDDHLVLDSLGAQEVSWLLAARLDALCSDPLAGVTGQVSPLPPLPAGSRLPGLLGGRGYLREEGPVPPPLPGGVRLEGVDAITLEAAGLLVEVGVRRFDLVDPRPVDLALAERLPAGGFGMPRSPTVGAALTRPGVHIDLGRLASPDLVIVSVERSCDPSTVGLLMAEDRPHLVVIRREHSVTVGPLVVPGRTPCSHCVDLHHSDRDPRSPFVAEEARAWQLPALPPAVRHLAALEVARAALGTPCAVGVPSSPGDTAAHARSTAPDVSEDPAVPFRSRAVGTPGAFGSPAVPGAPVPGVAATLPLGGAAPWGREPCLVHISTAATARTERTRVHPRCGCTAPAAVRGPDSTLVRLPRTTPVGSSGSRPTPPRD